MILGTSRIWSKSGPVTLLTITKMPQRIQAKYGDILENIIYVNMGLKKNESFQENICPRCHVFLTCFSIGSDFCGCLNILFENNFVEMRIEK